VAVGALRAVARRPERDVVKYRYETCAEGAAVHGPFEPEYAALSAETRYAEGDSRAVGEAKRARWSSGFDAIWTRERAAREAHKATCPKGCTGDGRIAIEVSRKPERTGWRALSWHHSRALAEKHLASTRGGWETKSFDEVRIFPVDGGAS
jgi:hypothetical protein